MDPLPSGHRQPGSAVGAYVPGRELAESAGMGVAADPVPAEASTARGQLPQPAGSAGRLVGGRPPISRTGGAPSTQGTA